MSSSIGPARAALFALLTTASTTTGNALKGVQVTFGPPPERTEQQEIVAILGIRQPVEAAVVIGPQPNVRDEQYRIQVAVKCHDPAGTSETVETRCCAMYEAVREVVLTNPTLNGSLKFGAFPTGQESDGPLPAASNDGSAVPGWVMRMDLYVECRSRA